LARVRALLGRIGKLGKRYDRFATKLGLTVCVKG